MGRERRSDIGGRGLVGLVGLAGLERAEGGELGRGRGEAEGVVMGDRDEFVREERERDEADEGDERDRQPGCDPAGEELFGGMKDKDEDGREEGDA